MPLDPQVQAIVEQTAALGLPPAHTLSPQEARRQHAASRIHSGPPEPVERVEDRRLPGPDGEIPIRIYAPRSIAPLPALVYFHGGGWVVGSIETHDAVCRSLSNAAGCMVISVDYRLAPEHRFPAAAEDAYAATRWLAEHAGEVGADAKRLAVGGDSAGGNLAAVVTLMARERGGPLLVYQLLIYPVTDSDLDTASYRQNGDGYLLTKAGMAWFWDHYIPAGAHDRQDPYASPLRAPNLRDLPPALVITAEYDPLRDEGEAYATRLRESGVQATYSRYDGMVHGFVALATPIDRRADAIAEAAAGLRAAFNT
ncbi:MAG: alpha/beta hydrolase [Dehalococcoidia bacterium]